MYLLLVICHKIFTYVGNDSYGLKNCIGTCSLWKAIHKFGKEILFEYASGEK